eukprot:GFUD01010420.1.p1 GENE.GFUD01010420.1~~GFUD01010420.1.p1  ORF type:complete len:140 (-),score=37.71 GFUD01010420.1:115-534(-)
MSKWGSVPKCPACEKSVYPVEQIFAADRKPFHRGCINCQVRGCSNQLTAKGMHKHEGYNFCDWCHETLYSQREYGPGPGGETMEERRLREAQELEDREKRLREIEAMRNKKGDEDDDFHYHSLKIKQTMEIAPATAYCI